MAVESQGRTMYLELEDGTTYQGQSFGADESIAGELVFQTGLVGYPESLTDPSYRGQILVITFPLVGNYGVPSRLEMDVALGDMPAYFEAKEIHVAGLVVASYSGDDFSHFLAVSSLGTWLKEQGIPAMHGVDTRALTKRIRQEGNMLGRLLVERKAKTNGVVDHQTTLNGVQEPFIPPGWRDTTKTVDWLNPNIRNLVADGTSPP
jgi:carbamoyl-phosphate synthase/aspartate carbamoyltransferase